MQTDKQTDKQSLSSLPFLPSLPSLPFLPFLPSPSFLPFPSLPFLPFPSLYSIHSHQPSLVHNERSEQISSMKIFNYRLGTRLSLTDQKWNSLVKAGAQEVCHQNIWTNQNREFYGVYCIKWLTAPQGVACSGNRGQGFRGISSSP